jgi:hypothetical protein
MENSDDQSRGDAPDDAGVACIPRDSYQHPKQFDSLRGLLYEPPDDFAARVGRTVAIHVMRRDWRQAEHSLAAAQCEIEAVDLGGPSPEKTAALTSIRDIDLRPHVAEKLHAANYPFVADVIVARSNEIQYLAQMNDSEMRHLRNKIASFLHAQSPTS